jgi:hypothetical protein
VGVHDGGKTVCCGRHSPIVRCPSPSQLVGAARACHMTLPHFSERRPLHDRNQLIPRDLCTVCCNICRATERCRVQWATGLYAIRDIDAQSHWKNVLGIQITNYCEPHQLYGIPWTPLGDTGGRRPSSHSMILVVGVRSAEWPHQQVQPSWAKLHLELCAPRPVSVSLDCHKLILNFSCTLQPSKR